MTKMSKTLTDVLYVSGESKTIKELLKNLKDNGIKLVSVKFPKRGMTALEIAEFIDTKWKVTKFNLYDKVLIGSRKNSEVYLMYGSSNLTYPLREFAKQYGLTANHKFVSSNSENGVIVKETNCKGQYMEDIAVSESFAMKKYNFGMCLENE